MSEKRCSRRASGPAGNLTQIYAHRKKEDEEERFRKMWEEFEQSEEGAEIDPEQFLRDMAILDELNPLPDFDVSMSWAEFKEKYGYLLESINPADQQSSASVEKPKKRRRVKPIQVFLSVVAIIAILAISSCGIIDLIIEAIADWTEDIFGYKVTQEFHAEDVEPENANVGYYSSLEDALDELGITTVYAPTWYPEGFLFRDVRIVDVSYAIKIIASYIHGEEEILLTIWHYKDSAALKHQAAEKLPPDVKPYIRNNIEYYILDNTGETIVSWIVGTEMYMLTGDFSSKQAMQMVDSIYKGIN